MKIIHIILVLFIGIAILYGFINPPLEASDEISHYPMVETIASGNGLPVLDERTVETAYKQEGGQPPLYYLIGAALTFWIDTSDLSEFRDLNPHSDIGFIRPDGNVNMVVHPPNFVFPTDGSRLALYIVRLYSIGLATITVFYSYRLAKQLNPNNERVALLAAFLVAFNPMFLFISSSVNNDNLSNLIAVMLLVEVTALVTASTTPHLRNYVWLGVLMGCGMLAKFQLGLFVPILGTYFIVSSLQQKRWKPFLYGGFVTGGLTILIGAWWYIRNYQLYGDPTGISPFLDVVGRTPYSDASLLWDERNSFLQTFWGMFGAINVPLHHAYYDVFNGIALIGIFASLLYALNLAVQRKITLSRLNLARLVVMLWVIVNFVGLVRWTLLTPASQGRLMFTSLAPIMLVIAIGWDKMAQMKIVPRGIMIVPISFFTVMATIIAPLTIHNAYRHPPQIEFDTNELLHTFASVEAPDEVIFTTRLRSLDESARSVEYFHITLDVLQHTSVDHDYSIYVHLVNEFGAIVAQRDVYPGGGKLGTSDLEPGRAWHNPIAIFVPRGVYAPQTLEVVYGFYISETGQRLQSDAGQGNAVLGTFELLSTDGIVPNPISVRFGTHIDLIGYDIAERELQAGSVASIMLYWNIERLPASNTALSVQIIDSSNTKAAELNQFFNQMWDADATQGDVLMTTHELQITENARPAIYRLLLSAFEIEGDTIELLSVSFNAQERSREAVLLSYISIVE